MEPTDIKIYVKIDYIQLYSGDNASYISKKLSRYYVDDSFRRIENWASNKYFINNDYTLIHSYNSENYYQNTLKICQPTIQQQIHLHKFLDNLKIKNQLSKFELSFDMAPTAAGTVTNGNIHDWMAMHMHQKYVPKNVDPFWYEDTFYTRPTRQVQGRANRGLKLYQKLLAGSDEIIRCEIEMKRSYCRRKDISFPLTNIHDQVSNTMTFLEFDQKKFEKYMSKNRLRRFREEPKSMQEIVRKVQKKDKHWQKFFKEMPKWNDKFQQAVELFNLEMAVEVERYGAGDDDDQEADRDDDDGYG